MIHRTNRRPGSAGPAGGAAVNGISHNSKSEKQVILDSLRRHGGNRTHAARELGIHRSTLWRKIKSLGLD